MTKRKNLVLVRAGDKSLHRQWLANAGERSWDLMVSWYGPGEYEPVADELVINRKGGKWDVIHAHFIEQPDLLERYAYFWLPDDDIETDAASIELIFSEMLAAQLSVGQPALTQDSYFSHVQLLHAPSFRLRYTGFVEVMAPCLDRDLVRRMLPHFADSCSGFGLDMVWGRLAEDNGRRAAIIDRVAVRHTRPVGVFLASRLKAVGINPADEGKRIMARFGAVRRREFPFYAGVTAVDRPVGQWATAALMLKDFVQARRRWVQPRAAHRVRAMFRFFYRRPALSQLVEGRAAADQRP